MPTYAFPPKVFSYLRRLHLNYEHSGPRELAALLKHARVAVDIEKTQYHDFGEWNYGHDVVLYLTPEAIAPISMKQQATLGERLKEDLVQCAKGIANEFVNEVRIELEDEDDFLFQTGSPLAGQPPVNPDTLSFWKPGQIRLFISHRDKYKAEAQRLAISLENSSWHRNWNLRSLA